MDSTSTSSLNEWRRRAKVYLGAPEASKHVKGLSLLYLAGGVLTLYFAAFPFNPDPIPAISLVVGTGAIILGTVYWLAAPRFRVWMLMAGVVVAVLAGCLAVSRAADPVASAMVMSTLLWTCVLVGVLYRPPIARAFAVLVFAGLGTALFVAPVPQPGGLWIVFGTAFVLVIETLSRFSSQLRDDGMRDPLTGLLNRSGLDDALGRAEAIARRYREPLAIVVIDLDDFKLVNDRDGHAEGDRLLRETATAWQQVLEPPCVLARPGGDEFVAVLPGADADAVTAILARMEKVAPVGWSRGVAHLEEGEPLHDALTRADFGLYLAKHETRRIGESIILRSVTRGRDATQGLF